ncbi:16S rRNA (guanine527-N7)-methyltransferase [Bowdeniella nasicola]|uniref:Ribosomal RNA small subunit methyltransferase G n=1 Tax=Bowdeniella nasicola TaxID=208480 RepID=A0A1H4CRW9_9ACTO|nr:16S rRNA (guanine(527)-N(7))-methyltransferase RsmG [Bowdeniella nasicola]SEA63143.1 16S rRNA (guanine527-N7)-methyltransferase [Bowdeniella nasicola]
MGDIEEMPPVVKERFPETWGQLALFTQFLADEGEKRGLIGPRELPRLWSRHILNCTAINEFIPEGATVADIGSGAGLPGVVLAITRPDVHVTLVEPMERRIEWLYDVTEVINLENAWIVRARAEELHDQDEFQVVTARAVAALDKLMRWTMPLVADGGKLLALKGERAKEEVDAALKVRRKFKVASTSVVEVPSLVPDESPTNVVIVER